MVSCEKCGFELHIGDFPFCPHGRGYANVVGDECDLWVRNGICHEDSSPRHYTSKAEMKRVAKEKGLENRVRHIGRPGSDKSPFTTRWI